MKKVLIIILFLPLFFGSQCHKDECHENILFINNSNIPLYILGDSNYPDTLSFSSCGGFIKDLKVNAQSSSNYPLERRSCYESLFGYEIKSNILMVYVFNADTVDNNSWSYIIDNYKVLYRYELTLEDLQRMNWTVTYPQ
jgi:hypothetical protein